MHKTVKGLGGLAATDTMPCLVGTGQMQLFKGSSLLFFFFFLHILPEDQTTTKETHLGAVSLSVFFLRPSPGQ